ncbi:protein of unknown function (plasmid) [Cupriavidus taiwanensis]|nr:hypothetical protein [Cupriavidus taiwanensis]SPK74838.1 protein of unknown function [Cupriavidus taiwanensis]
MATVYRSSIRADDRWTRIAVIVLRKIRTAQKGRSETISHPVTVVLDDELTKDTRLPFWINALGYIWRKFHEFRPTLTLAFFVGTVTFFSAGLFFETALTFVAFVAATIVDYPLGRSGRNAGSLPWKAFGYRTCQKFCV